MAKGPEAPKAAHGGGGGSAVEKAKKAVESALSGTEIAVWNVWPQIEALRYLAAGKAFMEGALAGLVGAFGFSFAIEMIKGVLAKLGGGGH